MNQHELWVPTLKADWFRDLMKFLDGTCGDVTLGAMRDHIGREANLGPLDFMTACNHAFHAGILREDTRDVAHFDADLLDAIIERADAKGSTGYISVECVKPDCMD